MRNLEIVSLVLGIIIGTIVIMLCPLNKADAYTTYYPPVIPQYKLPQYNFQPRYNITPVKYIPNYQQNAYQRYYTPTTPTNYYRQFKSPGQIHEEAQMNNRTWNIIKTPYGYQIKGN